MWVEWLARAGARARAGAKAGGLEIGWGQG